MLAETLIRKPRRPGLDPLVCRGERGARELSAWRLSLAAGEHVEHATPGEEIVAVLLDGIGTFADTAGAGRRHGSEWRLSRAGVFAERASAVYVPPGHSLRVSAETPLEAVLIATPASAAADAAAACVRPDDIRVQARGRGGYAREVHDLFVTDRHVQRLMVGETFNPPGHWSSFPPHKHDGRDGEPTLEELYYFRLDPPQGFGHQMLYTRDGESVTHTVRDGDAVLLPYGYHPVSSPPGYALYYLWAMAGAERRLALYEDPDHRWIHDASL